MKKNNQKIFLAVGVISLVVLAAGGYAVKSMFFGGDETAQAESKKKKKVLEPVNVIPVEERPYISIRPEGDGRNLTVMVNEVKKKATEVDYELEYSTGNLKQGVFGNMKLDKLPAENRQLMGSCSAGGACTYHKDVTGGTLITRFSGTENYAIQSEFKYIENKDKEDAFSSTDAKFQIKGAELAKLAYAIIMNNSGYPEGLKGTLNSDTYSFQTSSALSSELELTMRGNEEGELKIMGYDGTKWVEFKGTVDGKSITAKVKPMKLYVVVK